MDITVSSRLGGPELGENVHGLIVTIRKELKAAFASLDTPGVEKASLTLYFSGSISKFSETGGISGMKFHSKTKELTCDILFTVPEVEANSLTELKNLIVKRLIEFIYSAEQRLLKADIRLPTSEIVTSLTKVEK